jgi:hypothetical protein
MKPIAIAQTDALTRIAEALERIANALALSLEQLARYNNNRSR